MTFVMIFLFIFIIAISLSCLLNKKLSLTFSLAIILITVVEYFSGIFGNLIIGKIIIFLLGFLSIPIILRKNKKVKITRFLDSSTILLVLLYFLSINLMGNKIVTDHNELGHWALIVKNFYYTNTIFTNVSNVLYSGYIPSFGLFEYWFASFFNNFNDGLLFIANCLFSESLVISVCYLLKNKFKFIISLLSIGLLTFVSPLIFTHLYAEPLLALLFMLSLVFITKSKYNLKNGIILCLLITGFTMIKATSLMFVLLLILIAVIKPNTSYKKILSFILPSIFATILIKYSWEYYIILNNLNQPWDTSGLSLNNFYRYISGKSQPYQYEATHNIINGILNNSLSTINFLKIKLPSFILILAAIAYTHISYIIKKDFSVKQLFLCTLFVNLLYITGLCAMYIFCFSQWETEQLSGFSRYMQFCNIFNLFIITYLYFNNTTSIHKQILKLIIPTLIVFIGYFPNIKNGKFLSYKTQKTHSVPHLSAYNNFSKNDKILLVTKHLTEMNGKREIRLLEMRYNLTPYKIFMTYTPDVSKKDILYKLNSGYNYIYFDNCDDDVISKYEFLSNEKLSNKGLYKINRTNDKITIEKTNIKAL